MTYTLTVVLSADENAEHLGNAHEIEDEVRSWLEGLGATVTAIAVEEASS